MNLHPNASDYNGRREVSRCYVPSGISVLLFMMLARLLGDTFQTSQISPLVLAEQKKITCTSAAVYTFGKKKKKRGTTKLGN